MVPLPFKDQQSANSVKKQMQLLSANIGLQIKPVFQTKRIGQILALKEKKKPSIVNNQCVVYKFESDLCDADYKQLLDEVFVISRIIEVEVGVISPY